MGRRVLRRTSSRGSRADQMNRLYGFQPPGPGIKGPSTSGSPSTPVNGGGRRRSSSSSPLNDTEGGPPMAPSPGRGGAGGGGQALI